MMFSPRSSVFNSLISVSRLRLNCSTSCNSYHSTGILYHSLRSKTQSPTTFNLVKGLPIRLSANSFHSSCDRSNARYRSNEDREYRGRRSDDRDGDKMPLLAAGFVSGLLSFLGWEDLLSKEDPFILTIKRGVLCIQREEFDKAEIILHAALTNAVTMEDEKAIIYIYSLLGNAAFLKGDLEKSETIYKDLIRRLLKREIEETHEAMVEISIKLATIYSKLGKFSKADVGFNHCIDIQKKRVIGLEDKSINEEENRMTADEINSYALYGMLLDFYGKHLLRKQEFEGALRYSLDALKICEKVNGPNAHQTMVLLSDVGTLLNLTNHFDEADKYFQRAIKVATIIESDHVKTLYYNIGMNNLMRRNYSQAQINCDSSYRYAQKEDDLIMMRMAEDCLKKVKEQLT